MKIALSTIGTRGDLQPYISLAAALKSAGHEPTILTHPWAKTIINQYGLEHQSVGDNIDINFAAKEVVENSSNNLKGFKWALNFIFDNLRKCHKDYLALFKEYDLVIGHGVVGESEAHMLNIPFVKVSIETMGLRRVYWKSRNFPKELSLYILDKFLTILFGKPYRKFRKEIGAPSWNYNSTHPYLALVPITPILQKTHANWKATTEITGYFFADTPSSFEAPGSLIDFLNSGKKPILITSGSMFRKPEDTIKLYDTISKAIKKSGSRAIILLADLDHESIDVPKDIYLIKQAPYAWLLKQVDLVVHHFGFGTSAEVLRSGLPSVPIPHIFDQNIRAKQIHKLGYASKPLNFKKLNSQTLSDAINNAKKDKQMIKKCKEAGIAISNENGVHKAVGLINQHFG